jgi:hypothetical protein
MRLWKKGLSALAAVVVLVLIVVSATTISFLLLHRSTTVPSSEITSQWLNQQLIGWRPDKNSSLNFQVFSQRASYGNLEYGFNTLGVEQADLNMLLSTGATCIRIDIGYAPWLQNNETAIAEVGTLVHDIRAAGRCVVIADAASETYRRGGQIPWAEFQQVWIERVNTLASLYHPDYYIVIKEPGWYVDLVSDSRTNPQFQNATVWLNLTSNLAKTVLSVSPGTKVGVSVAADSLAGSNAKFYDQYLEGVTVMQNVSFVGFDIYDVTGFQGTQNYMSQYGAGNKSVWIAEAWSGDGSVIYNASRAQLDSEWMQVLYYFALKIHASSIMPFYTDLFSSYDLTDTFPTNASQITALLQERTLVFHEFQKIVSSTNGTA